MPIDVGSDMMHGAALLQLQDIEVQILRKQKRLGEIAGLLQDDTVVAQARKRVETANKKLAPLKSAVRELELEIQANTQKANTTEQRLYDGTVKNPKVMQDMQDEIRSLEKWHGELEDRLLEAMVEVETAEGIVVEAEGSLQSATEVWEHQHKDLLDEQTHLEADITDLNERRTAALAAVPDDLLKVYNSMKKGKGNQPVAALQSRACSVCGIEQTTAIEQQVLHGQELVYCPNCGRILVFAG